MGLSKSDQQFVEGTALLRQSLRTSLIAAFATALLLMFLISGGNATAEALIIGLFFAAFGGVLTFQILRSGKVNKRRLLIFLLVALFFGTVFLITHQVHRGSILLTQTQIESADVPICPITIPFVIPPLVIRGGDDIPCQREDGSLDRTFLAGYDSDLRPWLVRLALLLWWY